MAHSLPLKGINDLRPIPEQNRLRCDKPCQRDSRFGKPTAAKNQTDGSPRTAQQLIAQFGNWFDISAFRLIFTLNQAGKAVGVDNPVNLLNLIAADDYAIGLANFRPLDLKCAENEIFKCLTCLPSRRFSCHNSLPEF